MVFVTGTLLRIKFMGACKASHYNMFVIMNGVNFDVVRHNLKMNLGNEIFKTWSCYLSGKMQCGKCESCNNRKIAFAKAKIEDKTRYLK